MIVHAVRDRPLECCGLLSGKGRRVQSIHLLENEARSTTEFHCLESLFSPFRHMRETGEELLAIYHSHPASPAVPSRKDLERNNYPDCVHFIISLAADPADVQAFWLEPDKFRPARWRVARGH